MSAPTAKTSSKCRRHFVPGYDQAPVPPGQKPLAHRKALRGIYPGIEAQEQTSIGPQFASAQGTNCCAGDWDGNVAVPRTEGPRKPGRNSKSLNLCESLRSLCGMFSKAHFEPMSHIFLLEKTPCFDTSSTHQNWLLNTEKFKKPESVAFTVPPNSKSPVSDGEFVCNGQGDSARLPVPMTPCHGLNG